MSVTTLFSIRTALITTILLPCLNSPQTTAATKRKMVRDAMWIWAHHEGAYNNSWGLPRNSSISPIEGAKSLGVPNLIMVSYNGYPKPPFDEYAAPLRSLNRIMWSIVGASGATSDMEREQVFELAAKMPNITGLFMDDFFKHDRENPPQWLAENNVRFPVLLTLTLPEPVVIDKVTLTQSDWQSFDYRSSRFAVDLSLDGENFKEEGTGILPNLSSAVVAVNMPKTEVRSVRIRIIGTHDTDGAMSCGLRRIQLWLGEKAIPLNNIAVTAGSEFPGQPAKNVLLSHEKNECLEVPAALSPAQLSDLRNRLGLDDRNLDLGVTLYTHQLDERIIPHLRYIDIVSLWTWKAKDLAHLEDNVTRFQAIAPEKRLLLGLYMWDFGTEKPMPLDMMKKQCELALKWLCEGRIEGMIFLATNICDMDLEAVNWARSWIAEIGGKWIR